jgi:hypothetical protein
MSARHVVCLHQARSLGIEFLLRPLPGSAYGLPVLPLPTLRQWLDGRPSPQLVEDALALHPLFEHAKSTPDIVVVNRYEHLFGPSWARPTREPAAP